jgi:RHH-type transcriptional regulator, proline utilization regulon repressor / proline dehydrogenase / delta 1-pyrroline-5-carboxylate dehydrogenase
MTKKSSNLNDATLTEFAPFSPLFPILSKAISEHYLVDEKSHVLKLIALADLPEERLERIRQTAGKLIQKLREVRMSRGGLDAFLIQYDLSSEEGIALMCLAEALLRIPDSDTADRLIQDKISKGEWEHHLGKSDSMFVNAATWSLMLTGKILNPEKSGGKFKETLKNFLVNNSEGVIRNSVRQAMKILGRQFVMGETIEEAQTRAKKQERIGYRFSYDMLGEAARTEKDALYYLEEYKDAIHAIGKAAGGRGPVATSGISIKLSALYPRYEVRQYEKVHDVLYERTKLLCQMAKDYDINLNIDAEEADRFEINLSLFERLAMDTDLTGWTGLGLVMQAYQKRTYAGLEWLKELAIRTKRRFMVRLVKGAYWDSEIKRAQIDGLSGYPVFTRKIYTDVSYIACAKFMLGNPDQFYGQFATHNAYTLSVILELANGRKDFEFQCLHGMGDTLYDQIVGKDNFDIPCRIYAPVGTHKHLLAYLVRRLLENGANSSFVNRIIDESQSISSLTQDPVSLAKAFEGEPNRNIPLPRRIYGQRKNSIGLNLSSMEYLNQFGSMIQKQAGITYQAGPLTNAEGALCEAFSVKNPGHSSDIVGQVREASPELAKASVELAKSTFLSWSTTSAHDRAELLRKFADLLEAHTEEFMLLTVREAGKTWGNALNEVREAVDFCRYYAEMAEQLFGAPIQMPGPTGEKNSLFLAGRGPIVCISPWNFPLAIFTGQITAALAAGNTVLAKPAETTVLTAYRAIELLYEAGFPKDVVQLLPGAGSVIGSALVSHPDVRGVMFTGSTEVARLINQTLAAKEGPIVPLIAETGGQNCMIVDSSALPEQVVRDAITSAFDSAGQRCSALRVLYVQEDIAETIIEMLIGAMRELKVDNPMKLTTDIGPVIDAEAQKMLQSHIKKMNQSAQVLYQCELPKKLNGTYVPPTLIEIKSLSELSREVFGPVLHVIRFSAKELNRVIEDINATGYGLTFGLHTRIDLRAQAIAHQIHAGNIYINRNTVGAVVGVQPFGGEGLSGTGPKAGGPHYLLRLATERCVSIDTTASGGNASLMSLGEDD